MLEFLLGLLLGAGAVWFLFLSARFKITRLREEKQMLQQEKLIVVEFMHKLVEAVGEGVDRETLFKRMVNAAILSTNALSACVFAKSTDGGLKGVAVEGLFPPQKTISKSSETTRLTRAEFIEQVMKSEVFEMGEGLVGSVAQNGKGLLIEDALNDPRVVQQDDATLQVRSLILAPIMFRKEVIGVLAVANPNDGLSFTQTDFSLVESIADQAGMAIHNADLMKIQIEKNKLDLDISTASSIQGMILPKTFPKIEGLDIAALYKPAQKIGGDLYDVFELEDGKLGFAVADVSGKGIPASLLMAICQTNLRRFAKDYHSPADVLRALNREVGPEMRQDMFVTFIYGIIDVKTGSLLIARAGHELPLLLHKNKANGELHVGSIGSEGMAIGMVPPEIFDTTIEDKKVAFTEGDILVCYTDGVTESTDHDGLEFSEFGLSESIRKLRGHSAEEINNNIMTELELFTGSAMIADDLTLMTVRHV